MINTFDTREAASAAVASRIQQALQRRLEAHDQASLVVSGGSTPHRTLELLARSPLDWARIHVVPSDERWVDAEHPESNEKLLRSTLLQGNAAAANLLPFHDASSTPEQQSAALDERIRLLPFPFAAALLGMGEDGHFASLFPDADNLDDALNVESSTLSVAVHTSASPHARISLTLAALSRSDEILLLVFGDRKRTVVEKAMQSGNTYPVAQLFLQKRAPVAVFWAP
jgi:6-phosphogluconolactonase